MHVVKVLLLLFRLVKAQQRRTLSANTKPMELSCLRRSERRLTGEAGLAGAGGQSGQAGVEEMVRLVGP